MRLALAAEFTDVWVAGEISGVKSAPSGHIYFTLKDASAQIRCAFFARAARFSRFKPQDGAAVLVRGRVDIYGARGDIQFLVDAIEPRGFGQLQIAFEQLKQRLTAEGLFDAARKRPLPKYPRRIGIVTSPSGAVIRDMLNILTRRFSGLHIRLYPALVQGEGSVEQVCRGIDFFSQSGWAEVLIVARGGGSVEDLWTFNEEAVARRIAACPIPVVSAVGHETDFTIADFVADLRAPTPSAAAELVVGTKQQLVERLEGQQLRLRQVARYRISEARRLLHQLSVTRAGATLQRMVGKYLQRTDELDGRLEALTRGVLSRQRKKWTALDARLQRMNLQLRLAEAKRRMEAATQRMEDRMHRLVLSSRRRFEPLDAHLVQLSPLKILDRGYAIVLDKQDMVIKDAAQVDPGATLQLRLARGRLDVTVEGKHVAVEGKQ